MNKKLLIGLSLIFVASAVMQAQVNTGIARHITYAASAPATCSTDTGDIYFKTTATVGPFYCSAANTWSSMAGSTGGVTSITGTANQVIASAATGAITLSLPQSIATASTPQFAGLGIGAAGASSQILNASGTNSLPAYSYSGDPNTGFYSSADGIMNLSVDANRMTVYTSTQVGYINNVTLGWYSASFAAFDTSLSRVNPGIIAVGTGSNGSFAGGLQMASWSIASTLPAGYVAWVNAGTSGLNGRVYMANLTTSSSAQSSYHCGAATGEVIADSTTCLVSAAKFKRDIEPLDLGLDTVLRMRPVVYYKKVPMDASDSGQQFGFVADEAEQLDRRLVTFDSEGHVHGFRYEQYTAILTKAIQELTERVKTLENKR